MLTFTSLRASSYFYMTSQADGGKERTDLIMEHRVLVLSDIILLSVRHHSLLWLGHVFLLRVYLGQETPGPVHFAVGLGTHGAGIFGGTKTPNLGWNLEVEPFRGWFRRFGCQRLTNYLFLGGKGALYGVLGVGKSPRAPSENLGPGLGGSEYWGESPKKGLNIGGGPKDRVGALFKKPFGETFFGGNLFNFEKPQNL